ncbi:MAG TPA: hypothetical protein VGL13_07560 [Polyangiaceae bacterium]|jgi:hypothetical protein
MKSIFACALGLTFAAMVVLVARADTGASGAANDGKALPVLVGADAGPPPAGYSPDPRPLTTRQQWVMRFAYRTGQVFFRGANRVDLARAVATPRVFGRFAVELYIGKELVDRVRFDFPMLGADDPGATDDKLRPPAAFAAGLTTQSSVQVPRSDRATRAALVDRATGVTWALPWPPVTGPDAGVPAG